jgi:hypothetical protein
LRLHSLRNRSPSQGPRLAGAQGKVWLSFNDPHYLQSRYNLSDEVLQPITGLEALIQQAIA